MSDAVGASVCRVGERFRRLGPLARRASGNHRLREPRTPLRVTPCDRVDDQYIPCECIARLAPIFLNPARRPYVSTGFQFVLYAAR